MILLLAVAVFALSAGFTWCLRRYALEKGVLDIPNDRSSHQVPTPRGGGLAIAAAFLFGVVALGFVYPFSANVAVALISGGALAALVGFWDDHRPLSPGSRLAIHFCAALVVLFAIGGFPRLSLFGVQAPDWLLGAFSLLFLVLILNLYNFMDGIDGIAGLEAVTVCAGGSAIGILPITRPARTCACCLGRQAPVSSCGTFPPARIFMGDVGSGFLGLVLGILALDFALQEPRLFWSWLILLGSFIVDASVTLVRRLLRRERVYLAHRTHTSTLRAQVRTSESHRCFRFPQRPLAASNRFVGRNRAHTGRDRLGRRLDARSGASRFIGARACLSWAERSTEGPLGRARSARLPGRPTTPAPAFFHLPSKSRSNAGARLAGSGAEQLVGADSRSRAARS